jgi:acyl-CoA dehydrogenase family protein 9
MINLSTERKLSMPAKHSLANLYWGSLERIDLTGGEETAPDAQAAEIIRQYREMTAAHPDTEGDDMQQHRGKVLQHLKKLGFFGLTIPKAYGGLGISLRQYLKIVEKTMASGMALGFTALAHLSIGVKGIVLFGTEEQKRKYLVPAASGEMIFSYALTEPNTGSDARNIETTATLSADGRHYILNGSKTYITNANLAGAMTVFAQMDPDSPGHMGAFIVETGWEGVRIGKDMPKMGLKASSTAAVQFKNVHVPRENLLGQPGDGFKIAMTILNYGRLALGAGSAGMMKQSLRDMNGRAKRRTQFGVAIGEFGLIQEKLIKAKVNGAVASAMTEFTAAILEGEPLAKVAVESSHCKLFGTTRAWDTLYDALQVAGGSGYLTTQPYEKRMRDFRVTTIFEGTTEIHSIYPALYILRKLTKRMQAETGGRLSQMLFLAKELLILPRWKLRFGNRAMNRAKRFAWTNVVLLRWMLAVGLLTYGGKIPAKQFFLRRITHLSLELFGTLALLSRIEAARQKGRDMTNDLHLLDYFISAAKTERKANGFWSVFRHERLHKRVAAGLGLAGPEKNTGHRKSDPAMAEFSSSRRRTQDAG